jgi:AcrR family transcriptional regulator
MARIKPAKNSTRKEVIIHKASALFRIKGFSATSMRDLAESVGVEAPSLYNHIGSKMELLQDICFKIAGEFTVHLEKTISTRDSWQQKLEEIIRFHIHMMQEEFEEVFVANHEWKHLEESQLAIFLNQRRGYEKRLVALVEAGQKAGEFKNNNPYVIVLTILSALRGLEFLLRHKKNFSSQELEKDMVEHLLHGIVS